MGRRLRVDSEVTAEATVIRLDSTDLELEGDDEMKKSRQR